jgi:hypothetical protein
MASSNDDVIMTEPDEIVMSKHKASDLMTAAKKKRRENNSVVSPPSVYIDLTDEDEEEKQVPQKIDPCQTTEKLLHVETEAKDRKVVKAKRQKCTKKVEGFDHLLFSCDVSQTINGTDVQEKESSYMATKMKALTEELRSAYEWKSISDWDIYLKQCLDELNRVHRTVDGFFA